MQDEDDMTGHQDRAGGAAGTKGGAARYPHAASQTARPQRGARLGGSGAGKTTTTARAPPATGRFRLAAPARRLRQPRDARPARRRPRRHEAIAVDDVRVAVEGQQGPSDDGGDVSGVAHTSSLSLARDPAQGMSPSPSARRLWIECGTEEPVAESRTAVGAAVAAASRHPRPPVA